VGEFLAAAESDGKQQVDRQELRRGRRQLQVASDEGRDDSEQEKEQSGASEVLEE
jgi:hypothetical protein